MNSTAKKAILAGSSLLLGGAIGVLSTKVYFQKKYAAQAEWDIANVKEHYRLLTKEATPTVESAVKLLHPEHDMSQYDTRSEEVPEDVQVSWVESAVAESALVRKSIFEDDKGITQEMIDARGDDPFIISVQEFHEHEQGWEKITLRFYEEDGQLADENDGMIPDEESVVGSEALTKFGIGSEDNNIVYVRNEAVTTDFEVIRVKASYMESVLGIKEPKESKRKMREDD